MTRVIQPSFVFWVVVNPQSRLGGLQQLEHEKSKKNTNPTSAATSPRSTSTDELFFGTAARKARRSVPSGSSNKKIPARGGTDDPGVQSSASSAPLRSLR